MIRKRSWLGVLAIPTIFAIFAIGAERARSTSTGGTIDPSCTSSSPCIEYSNTSTGAGIRGDSAAGFGVVGTTKFISTSPTNFKAGVLGLDNSTSGSNDAGVRGLSVRGIGVAAQTGTGINPGPFAHDAIFGNSAGGGINVGVEGAVGPPTSSGGLAGVQGTNNKTSTAVRANGFGGLLFVGNNSHGANVFTVDDAGSTSIAGNGSVNGLPGFPALSVGTSASSAAINATGFSGIIGTGTGSNSWGVLAVNNGTGGGEALDIQDASGLGVLINAFDKNGTTEFVVDDSGTVHANSFVTPALVRRMQRTSAGPAVTTYAHQSSVPTLEDFGQAQLVAGEAYVSLERTFSTAIDHRSSYMVFLTADGDTRGLFVTQKTPTGFLVRENQGGRSTVAFDYRIVARPYGSTEARLAPMPAFRFAPPPHMPPQRPAVFGRGPKSNLTPH